MFILEGYFSHFEVNGILVGYWLRIF